MDERAAPRPPRAPRLPGLDLLRALAIASVMLYHAGLSGLVSDAHRVVAFGWMGVDLFFALSGFLIAGQLLRPWAQGRRPDYRRFLSRRLLRTLPAYLAVLAVYVLLPDAREVPAMQPPWQFLSFTENLLIRVPPAKAFSHVWSLCVEEQFYLVLPVAAALLAVRPSAARVATVVLAVLLGGIALRGLLWLEVRHALVPLWLERIYYPSWTRLDGLLAGVVAATVQVFRPGLGRRATRWPDLLLASGILVVAGAVRLFQMPLDASPLPAMLGFPMVSVGMAMTVMAGSTQGSVIARVQVPGARALATGAYSLYLSHKIAFGAVTGGSVPVPTPAAAPFVALAVALILGTLLHLLVERPFLLLRDRLDGRSRTTLAR